jgi:hypothetical protein
MEVLVPVIARGVERIVHALPRGALRLLEKNADVTPLVGDKRFSPEMLGHRGKQLVRASSRARDVNDDRGQRHECRSYGLTRTPGRYPRARDGYTRLTGPSVHSARAVPSVAAVVAIEHLRVSRSTRPEKGKRWLQEP